MKAPVYTPCLKNSQNCFFPQLCQMFTKFDNLKFGTKMAKKIKYIQRALIFHLT